MRRYFMTGTNAKYGEDQRMLGRMLWPLIRDHCLVHDKYYHLAGVQEVKIADSKSHFGAGHRNIDAVLKEVELAQYSPCPGSESEAVRGFFRPAYVGASAVRLFFFN